MFARTRQLTNAIVCSVCVLASVDVQQDVEAGNVKLIGVEAGGEGMVSHIYTTYKHLANIVSHGKQYLLLC
jgi:hypothetical protein